RGAVHPLGGVGPQAEAGPPADAVAAGAARDVERHGHPVADLDPADTGPDRLDDAHVLVAEDLALLDRGTALVHVQVGPADVGRGDPHDRVARLFDRRVRAFLDSELARTPV